MVVVAELLQQQQRERVQLEHELEQQQREQHERGAPRIFTFPSGGWQYSVLLKANIAMWTARRHHFENKVKQE